MENEAILRAMLGKNAEHYLEKFRQIEAGEKTKFQWSAFFLGPGFLLYRKCNMLVVKYYGIPLVLAIIASTMLGIGTGLFASFSNMELGSMLMTVASIMSNVVNIWYIVIGIILGKKFPKLYLEYLNELIIKENIVTVEDGQDTIKHFATTNMFSAVAFMIGYMVIVMALSTGISQVMINATLDSLDDNVQMEDMQTTDNEVAQTGGLLDLNREDLYTYVLGKTWVDEDRGSTFYIESDGISATDGYIYIDGSYVGSYSAYGVYGATSDDITVSGKMVSLEVWWNDDANDKRIYEITVRDAETLNIYDEYNDEIKFYYYDDTEDMVDISGESSTNDNMVASKEDAREYLIACMAELYPEFNAREDLAYSYQGETDECYSFQVLAKQATTTSNSMGFYSVFKVSGEVYNDTLCELIWTPMDGLIN